MKLLYDFGPGSHGDAGRELSMGVSSPYSSADDATARNAAPRDAASTAASADWHDPASEEANGQGEHPSGTDW